MGFRDSIKEKISLSRSSSISSRNSGENKPRRPRSNTVDAFGTSNNETSYGDNRYGRQNNFYNGSSGCTSRLNHDAFGSTIRDNKVDLRAPGDDGDAFGVINEEIGNNTLGGKETSFQDSFKQDYVRGDAFGAETNQGDGPNVLGDASKHPTAVARNYADMEINQFADDQAPTRTGRVFTFTGRST